MRDKLSQAAGDAPAPARRRVVVLDAPPALKAAPHRPAPKLRASPPPPPASTPPAPAVEGMTGAELRALALRGGRVRWLRSGLVERLKLDADGTIVASHVLRPFGAGERVRAVEVKP